jgi:hypothetical protein
MPEPALGAAPVSDPPNDTVSASFVDGLRVGTQARVRRSAVGRTRGIRRIRDELNALDHKIRLPTGRPQRQRINASVLDKLRLLVLPSHAILTSSPRESSRVLIRRRASTDHQHRTPDRPRRRVVAGLPTCSSIAHARGRGLLDTATHYATRHLPAERRGDGNEPRAIELQAPQPRLQSDDLQHVDEIVS